MKVKNYWTLDKCQEEALKYESRKKFGRNSYAYQAAKRNGWLDFVCSHMIQKIKPKGYYTKEKCREIALAYKTRNEFNIKDKIAHGVANKNGWLNEICSHMNYVCNGMTYKSKDFWTKEKCKEEALKYQIKMHYKIGSKISYRWAKINNWLEEICSHMKVIGNSHKRCIYSYEFSNNHVYVGLTGNLEDRNIKHLTNPKSQVFKHIQKTNLTPIFKKLIDYIDVELAKIEEGNFVNDYKNKGWIILNKNKTGGIGGTKKWTKEKCRLIALKYGTKKEFRINDIHCYIACGRYKWINELCSHMNKTVQSVYWTKEKCGAIALKYKTKKEFGINNINAYNACVRNKWINELCSHMNQYK